MRSQMLVRLMPIALGFVVGCVSTEAQSQEVEKPVTLRMAHCFGPKSFLGEASQGFANLAKSKSGGKITIQVFPAGQLFNCQAMPEAVSAGTADLGLNMTTYITQIIPEFGVWSLPALFKSDDHAFAATQGKAATLLGELAAKKGVHVTSYWAYGGLQWYANKEIKLPSDMKGMKMRVNTDVLARVMESMGGTGVFVEANEVYAAMQRGTIDGYMNGKSTLVDRKLYEVTKFGIDVNQGYVMAMVTYNKKVWEGLPEPVRRILLEASDETRRSIQSALAADEGGKLEKAIQLGLKFNRPKPEELKIWEEAARPSWNDYLKRTGNTGETVLNAIVELGK